MASERCQRCWNLTCSCGRVEGERDLRVNLCSKTRFLPRCDCTDYCEHEWSTGALACDRDAGHTGPHRDPSVHVLWQPVT